MQIGKWIQRGALVALTTTTMVMVGCGGGGGGGGSSAAGGSGSGSGSGAGTGGANTAPTIAGSPATKINAGAAYALTPTAKDTDGDTLAFAIENRPSWATFSTATGQLSGTPTSAHAGTTANVVISVSDGKSSVAMAAFSITVIVPGSGGPVAGNAVALSWDVPTQTMDGQTLGDLSGYRIHYGKKASALVESIEVPSAGSNNFIVQSLTPGTYYFAVRAVTAEGVESELSNVISRDIS
jgi:hypothetical protein